MFRRKEKISNFADLLKMELFRVKKRTFARFRDWFVCLVRLSFISEGYGLIAELIKQNIFNANKIIRI